MDDILSNLVEDMKRELKNNILDSVRNMTLVKANYHSMPEIPHHIVQKVWDSFNWDEIIAEVKVGVQDRLCKTIIEAMVEESKTDIKKILSVAGVRDKLKMEVYPKLINVLNAKEAPDEQD